MRTVLTVIATAFVTLMLLGPREAEARDSPGVEVWKKLRQMKLAIRQTEALEKIAKALET